MELFEDALLYVKGEKFSPCFSSRIKQEGKLYDRMEFVENIVRGKSVIHIGCLGDLNSLKKKIKEGLWFHGCLSQITSACLGIDNNRKGVEFARSSLGISNICYGDIENETRIEEITANKYWDYAVFGEVIEYVDNPIKYSLRNIEMVNSDHRYWFSPYTIWKVAHRAGLAVERIQMCRFSTPDGLRGRIRDFILSIFPVMAEDIVVICRKKQVR